MPRLHRQALSGADCTFDQAKFRKYIHNPDTNIAPSSQIEGKTARLWTETSLAGPHLHQLLESLMPDYEPSPLSMRHYRYIESDRVEGTAVYDASGCGARIGWAVGAEGGVG